MSFEDRLNLRRQIDTNDLEDEIEELEDVPLSERLEISEPNQTSNIKERKMAYSYAIRREDYEHLSTFDGNPSQIVQIVGAVNEIYSLTCQEKNELAARNHDVLFLKVKSKLTGQANHLLITKNFNNLTELLAYLQATFKDSRSHEQLLFELMQIKPYQKEHPLDFILRINNIRVLIYSRAKLDFSAEEITPVLNLIEKQIKHHIMKNLHPDLSAYIMTQNPDSLETIRNLIQNNCSLILDRLYPNGNNYGQCYGYDRPTHLYKQDAKTITKYEKPKPRPDYRQVQNYHYPRQEYRPVQNYQQRQDYRPTNYRHPNSFYKPNYNNYNKNYQTQGRPFQNKTEPWDRSHRQDNSHQSNRFSTNTVSMRTEQTKPRQLALNYLETGQEDTEKDDKIKELTEQMAQIKIQFDHFLERGGIQPAPNIY